MGFCNYSIFCCALLCVHSSFAIISMWKRDLVALLCFSSWCLVIAVWLFLAMQRVIILTIFNEFFQECHIRASNSLDTDLRPNFLTALAGRFQKRFQLDNVVSCVSVSVTIFLKNIVL